jgi:hypothetical protein
MFMAPGAACLDRQAELSQKDCCAIFGRVPVEVLPAWRGMLLHVCIQAPHAVEEHVVVAIIAIIAIF